MSTVPSLNFTPANQPPPATTSPEVQKIQADIKALKANPDDAQAKAQLQQDIFSVAGSKGDIQALYLQLQADSANKDSSFHDVLSDPALQKAVDGALNDATNRLASQNT